MQFSLYAALANSTEGDIVNSIEWSLLQDRRKCEEERRAIRHGNIGLGRTVIVIPQLQILGGKYSNYVLAQMQLQWNQCGLYKLTQTNDCEYVVARDGIIRNVKWAEECHVAECTCQWPSSRLYLCRHVFRVSMELKRGKTQTLTLTYTHKVTPSP
jgi:hypothetical protein